MDVNFPYVFVEDDAFPLRHNLIKPFPSSCLEQKFLIANYRISRAQGIIENTFGIMASRFRIFRR
ncbi:transposase family protein, partial [Acinetobacter baumannii]|uniref:transposase family protein n=1 Tax=Acinetobacter baumannii TaxID=470 RepID=UPI0034D40A8F